MIDLLELNTTEGTLMLVPNYIHHSKKEAKRKLKPQQLRQAKYRLKALKRKLLART